MTCGLPTPAGSAPARGRRRSAPNKKTSVQDRRVTCRADETPRTARMRRRGIPRAPLGSSNAVGEARVRTEGVPTPVSSKNEETEGAEAASALRGSGMHLATWRSWQYERRI